MRSGTHLMQTSMSPLTVCRTHGAPEPERLRALLRQTGLHAALLADFYAGAPEPEAARCIVLDYADAEPEALQGALRRLAAEITDG